MFKATDAGLFWNKPHGVGVQLTNFVAFVRCEFIGKSGERLLGIEAIRTDEKGEKDVREFAIPAVAFARMAWASEGLGAAWVVLPGMKDRARAAIRMLSGVPEERLYFGNAGWERMSDGSWAFAHAGGAMGPSEAVHGAHFEVAAPVERFELPEAPEEADRIRAIRASMKLLDLAPATVTFPIFCAIWRSVLGACDFSVFLSGSTGAMKSSLAALAQQHFGKGLDANHLPGSWSSTENALESLAHAAKDVLLVIDDFAPTGTRADIQALHKKAERVLRAQGNGAGRQRLRSDLSLVSGSAPRGLILATGEDTPKGQSLRARLFITEIAPGQIDVEKLTACQADANAGLYAAAMAAFLEWLAPKYDQVQAELPDEVAKYRASVKGLHARTGTTVGNLVAAFEYFTEFATEEGALTIEEASGLRGRCWAALNEVAANQEEEQVASDPAHLFFELLKTALATGAGHLASPMGTEPESARVLGWTGNGTLKPNGKRIGWIQGSDLYLEQNAAFLVANRVAGRENAIPIPWTTLKKRLFEGGLLASTETRGGKRNLVVRKDARRGAENRAPCSCRVGDWEDPGRDLRGFQPRTRGVRPHEASRDADT